jgi:hypothetical protein
MLILRLLFNHKGHKGCHKDHKGKTTITHNSNFLTLCALCDFPSRTLWLNNFITAPIINITTFELRILINKQN